MRDPFEGLTEGGTILTGARRDQVAAAFEPVLTAASERFKPSTSLYVYGSVATGQARPGSSDVDLLAVGEELAGNGDVEGVLSDAFREICCGVEVARMRPADLAGEHDAAYGNRVFLRHYCVHLAGPEAHAGLPDFPGDRRAARGFNGDIVRHAERWRTALAEGADPAPLARQVARKTLLAVAGLVSVHDGTWTTDRLGGARRWAQIEPGRSADLETLVSWSEDGLLPSHAGVTRMLGEPLDGLVHSFDSRIGLWR